MDLAECGAFYIVFNLQYLYLRAVFGKLLFQSLEVTMSVGLGMRGKDVRIFCMMAQKYNVYILVRQTNQESLNYIGKQGYYPKPAAIKAKTADIDPPLLSYPVNGQYRTVQHKIAGLVPHPWFQPDVFLGEKLAKAKAWWLETFDIAASPGCNVPRVDRNVPDTWKFWGQEHFSVRTGWRWKIDIDPSSIHFGCIQIARDSIPCSYLHGDYDLKDVIVKGKESYNERIEGKIQGVKNYTPLLPGLEFETIRKELNEAIGVEMVQHGAAAQFAGHDDEPIIVILPDGPSLQYLVLGNAEAVQGWYMKLNRELIAKNGKDYLGDKSRWFWFGNHGNLFLPDKYK